jgi:hypothetical protein
MIINPGGIDQHILRLVEIKKYSSAWHLKTKRALFRISEISGHLHKSLPVVAHIVWPVTRMLSKTFRGSYPRAISY